MTLSDIVKDMSLSKIKMYFDSGIPKGNELFNVTLKLEPKLVSFSIQFGSPGGSLIIANVQGIGP